VVFKKGDPRPPGAGRKKGIPNKVHWDLKAALQEKGPRLAEELVDIALNCKNAATRVLAIRECFDRMLGKASQPIDGQITHGISRELQQLLERHDGSSRSVPQRNGYVIEHARTIGDEPTGSHGELIEHE
jgi:hypothetical protein